MKQALSILALTGATMSTPAAFGASVSDFNHIVVIYQENHSFDNLYGMWGSVNGMAVEGLPAADEAHTKQVRSDNATAYSCLLQNDVNLTSPSPLATTCTDNTGTSFESHFDNAPFRIDSFIAATDTTCPAPGVYAPNGVLNGSGLTGGCTRDLVHRYYNEQYQIHGGKQDRYVTGSDAVGLSMGYFDTTKLPIYKFLHRADAPNYVIADHFFQAAFGGSFLNHQWLIAAKTPSFANAVNNGGSNDLHSVVDENGMPTSTPLYSSPLGSSAKDASLTASCRPPTGRPATPASVVCGNYAINTIQPTYQPYSPNTAEIKRLPPLTHATIGDLLTTKGVDWAWYSGGWSNAAGVKNGAGWTNGAGPTCGDANALPTATFPYCPDKLFQFHHQAFNYFANYAPGTPARKAHLRDEVEFVAAVQRGMLKAVSFVKPLGEENEHPGYASETEGDTHLTKLIRAILSGPNGDDTLIIVTYDEFGGQWDHVPPPGQGRAGVHDRWGPGTRIPAVLISKKFTQSAVDHTDYDTTSILRLIEQRYGLAALGPRDGRVSGLAKALKAGH